MHKVVIVIVIGGLKFGTTDIFFIIELIISLYSGNVLQCCSVGAGGQEGRVQGVV